MHFLLAASAQAVHVVNTALPAKVINPILPVRIANPVLHVRVMNPEDPTALQGLKIAADTLKYSIWTFRATLVAIAVAALAARYALVTLRKTQEQLNILLRKPNVQLGISRPQNLALPLGSAITAGTIPMGLLKRYTLVLAVHNIGDVEAEECHLSVVLKRGSGVSLDDTKVINHLPVMAWGTSYTENGEEFNELYIDVRTIQKTPTPMVRAQVGFQCSTRVDAGGPVEVILRCACSGGNFFETKQTITFQ